MAEENGLTSTAMPVEAPRGFFSARVDEKGRLKLPAAITQYLGALGENKVFVTTLNGSTARIYPISAWLQTENLLEEPGEDAPTREDVAFIASHFGADSELDPQGRVLVPTELRRALKLENEQVYLRCFKQRIDVIGREVYEERLAKAMEGLGEKVQALEKQGLR
ncbi:MAG: division/cell wall cluster transcriptional repressor MraZ [Bryobacteraceae bacterium]